MNSELIRDAEAAARLRSFDEGQTRLPFFCHSIVDDLPMTLEAFRVYGHLVRKWGNGKTGALGSYNDIAEHCYRASYPKASSATLRRKAIAAVSELIELNLLHKESRRGKDDRNLSNLYILHDIKVVVSSHQGECIDTRVVPLHKASAIAPKEDTNIEDTSYEGTTPPTPSSKGENESIEVDKAEEGNKPQSIVATLEDKPPIAVAEPQSFAQDNSSVPAVDPFFNRRPKPNADWKKPDTALPEWFDPETREVYPAFIRWKAQKRYKDQDGSFGRNPEENAISEILNIKNRDQIQISWQNFLAECDQVATNAIAASSSGLKPVLPPWLGDKPVLKKEDVMSKLSAIAGIAQVALPQSATTASCNVSIPWMPSEDTLPSNAEDGASDLTPQDQEKNIRRIADMIRGIKSMPKLEQREPDPMTHWEKMRSWLRSGEPILHKEATDWVYRCEDVEPVFDEQGSVVDFREIEF